MHKIYSKAYTNIILNHDRPKISHFCNPKSLGCGVFLRTKEVTKIIIKFFLREMCMIFIETSINAVNKDSCTDVRRTSRKHWRISKVLLVRMPVIFARQNLHWSCASFPILKLVRVPMSNNLSILSGIGDVSVLASLYVRLRNFCNIQANVVARYHCMVYGGLALTWC
jgi:hypothetical protein